MSTGLLSQLEAYYTQIDGAQSPIRPDEVAAQVDSPVRVMSVSSPAEQHRSWLVVVAIAVVVLVGGATWIFGVARSDSPSAPPPTVPTTLDLQSSEDPAAVLVAYEDARNAKDVDALMALYADDAVVTGHPRDFDKLAEGVDEIRALEQQVPSIMGANGFTEFQVIEVSGNHGDVHPEVRGQHRRVPHRQRQRQQGDRSRRQDHPIRMGQQRRPVQLDTCK